MNPVPAAAPPRPVGLPTIYSHLTPAHPAGGQLGKLTKLNEVNAAANQLMMLTDDHLTSWGSVSILTLNDNRLVRLGSLAPLSSLCELRLFANK